MKPPLRNLLVVELARSLAGPLAGMMLADLGARVVKIEPPGGDETRGWGPPFVQGTSTYFMSANRGKESVVLDLKTGTGRRLLQRLLRRADVVIENYRPSTARRLGLTPAVLRGKIHCAVSGYGRRGPRADKPAYDLIIQAESGAMLLNGDPDGPPMKIGVTLADVLAAHYAVQGILAALAAGRAGRVEVSLLDSILAGFTHHSQAFVSTGRVPRRHGNDHPSIYPYGVFETADGPVAIGVANDRQWHGLARVLDRPDLARRYPTNASRVQDRERLGRLLRRRLKSRPRRTLLKALARARVPAGAVQSLKEAFAQSRMAVRGLVGSPLGGMNRRRPPRLGEHTESVIRWLG